MIDYIGTPPGGGGWDEDELRTADELVLTLSETDGVDGVMRDNLIAEYWTKSEPFTTPKKRVRVMIEGGGIYPIIYDRDAVEAAESIEQIRDARED